jgi:N-acyl-D-aspartate/D-glutamate deacylase
VDLTFDMYPYPAACTHLLMMLPEWAQAGGQAAAMLRLAERDQRLRSETAARLAERGVITLSSVQDGEELEGRNLGELALSAGRADVDELFDLLARHDGRALAIYHWPADIDGDGIIRRTLAHPLYMGSTDGIYVGTRPHRRGFGTFARIVGDHVRSGTLRLEQAVHKVSGLPATRFGLRDRGLLEPGRAADVTVFDPATLADMSSWDDGRVAPSGIEHVLVNGATVVSGGKPTGVLPGRIVGR